MSEKIKIAFDLGNNSLKIAAHKRGEWEFHELPLPENLMEEDTITMPNAFSAFLKKAKKDLHLPGGAAGLILPASQVICRLVSMPRMSVEQLMLNLPHEFSDFIHEDLHQYYCDYALCDDLAVSDEGSPIADELTMMAAAVEKQQVQDYIKMFGAGGFSLKRILPQEMTLIQLVKDCRQKRANIPDEVCFIDLGYLSTRIFVVQGDRIQTTRRIPIGGRDLNNTVADILNVDRFLADSYQRSNHKGILEHPRCVELYEHIAVEVLKLVNFYHFTYRQNQLDGLYLIGGGAAIQPLSRILEETLGMPALPVEKLLEGMEHTAQHKGAFVCAMGLMANPKEEG